MTPHSANNTEKSTIQKIYGTLSEILIQAARPFLNRKYDEGNDQRYGHYSPDIPKNAIWIHAVSVGEVQTAWPFIEQIKARDPAIPLLLSTTTKTGKAMSRQLMGDSVTRIYYPLDAPGILNRALDTLTPRAFVTVETEIWPEILYQLQKRGIPSFLLNGRLSETSYKKYSLFRPFWRRVLSRYRLLLVRTETERRRYIRLGVPPEKIKTTGDCKVDALTLRKNAAAPSQPSPNITGAAPIILAGSTHQGEEQIVLQAYRTLLKKHPALRLILAPRHPERARRLAETAQQAGYSPVLLMTGQPARTNPPEWQILIVDRIGALFPLYACVRAAFLGGSLVRRGGQNIMEPAIWGIPFCQGPDYRDFTEATDRLIREGVCQIIHDAAEMAQFFERTLAAPDPSIYAAGCRKFFAPLGGASERSWNLIKNCL